MKRFLISVTLFAIIASVISLFAASPASLAQRPTPTNIISPTPTPAATATTGAASTPDGTSSHHASKKEASPPQEGTVWGYVIDYSNGGAPQAGVPVVLDGGGWSTETVSDSNGFYKFAGLGSGEARLQLKLPPEAHPVNQDWPVHTGSADTPATNLGFYWGDDTPPLPVIASAEASKVAAGQAASLKITVKNQSGGDAHNLLVTVSLPPELTAADTQPANDGTTNIADHRVTIQLDALPDGENATFTVAANATDTLPDALSAEVSLVYDEQLTPQQLSVNLQPGHLDANTAANAKSVIPETGGTPENTLPVALPIAILSILFITGLVYAGIRGFSHRA